MKRLIAVLLELVMVLPLVACGGSTGENESNNVEPPKQIELDKVNTTWNNDWSEGDEFDPTKQTDDLASMFVYIGFTEDEAAEMETIFDTIGIHECRNIRLMPHGDGIDGLQAFVFDPYDSENLQVNCTVENRELCLVWLAGIPGYKPVFKIGFFGKPKITEEVTKESVDMFNRWVDDTDYHQPIEDSYLVTINWEEMKLSEYKEGALK